MSSPNLNEEKPNRKLWPHQAALVDKLFDPSEKKLLWLFSGVGLGATTTVVEAIRRLMQSSQEARVLVMSPSPMEAQYSYEMRNSGLPSELIDRYRFRELIDLASNNEFWPGGVSLITTQLVKQSDVMERILQSHWTLVFIEGVSALGPSGESFLRQLLKHADRVLVRAEYSDFNFAIPKAAHVINWRREVLASVEGRQLNPVAAPRLHTITYNLTEAELQLEGTVLELIGKLAGALGAYQTLTHELAFGLNSSPAALEEALQRLASDLEPVDPIREYEELENEKDARLLAIHQLSPDVLKEGRRLTSDAISLLDQTTTDSKLDAVIALIADLCRSAAGERLICVHAGDRATLHYLSSGLDGANIKYEVYHDDSSNSGRQAEIIDESQPARVFLASAGSLIPALHLTNITDLILYGARGSVLGLASVVNRFNPLARSIQLTVHFLKSTNGADPSESSQLKVLQNLLQV